jgi:hypothetical protein
MWKMQQGLSFLWFHAFVFFGFPSTIVLNMFVSLTKSRKKASYGFLAITAKNGFTPRAMASTRTIRQKCDDWNRCALAFFICWTKCVGSFLSPFAFQKYCCMLCRPILSDEAKADAYLIATKSKTKKQKLGDAAAAAAAVSDGGSDGVGDDDDEEDSIM